MFPIPTSRWLLFSLGYNLTYWIFSFFSRVDRVLRRSLGVSETAPTDTNVKPAPPVDPELPDPEEMFGDDMFGGKAGIHLPDHMKDDVSVVPMSTVMPKFDDAITL